MYATTVDAPVDRHVAPLVDAINRSPSRVETLFSCSGHRRRPAFPYVSFECCGLSFVRFALACATSLNAVTGGSTYVQLNQIDGTRISAVIRLISYPSGRAPEWTSPPDRLVELWWAELRALGLMFERQRADVPGEFRSFVRRQHWLVQHAPDHARLPNGGLSGLANTRRSW